MQRKARIVAAERASDVTADIVAVGATSNVIDFAKYRGSRMPSAPTPNAIDAEEALQEIAHHLLMAVRAIKKANQRVEAQP